jgi:cyclase
MIKTRIIPTLLYKDFTLVKGIKFDSWRRVGSLIQQIKVYSLREVDELIFLDISATLQGRSPDFNLIDDFADECFMPLTIGGGVKTVEDVRALLRAGADKVAFCSIAFSNGEIIRQASNRFGRQCIVAAIDAKKIGSNSYEAFIYNGTKRTGKDVVSYAKELENLGAGEILLTSIDQEGTMEGYDLELIRSVSTVVTIPVIASGGCGNFQHMKDALVVGKAHAISAASIFHFTKMTPLEAKEYLKINGINVRL